MSGSSPPDVFGSRPPGAFTRPPFSTRPPTLAPPRTDPAQLRPAPEVWRRRCAALARAAVDLSPVPAARLHHRRADILDEALADSAAAAAAWSMALAADPTHTPTRVALRGLALSLDDRTLLDRLARGPLLDDDALFLGAALLLRWPDPVAARGILDAVAGSGRSEPVLDALAAVALPLDALLAWLGTRAAIAPLPPALATLLGAALIDAGQPAAAAPLLAAPARVDVMAAWLRVEAIGDEPQPLAEALEILARHCELPTAGALRFLAAERLGGMGPWAERLYAEADGGILDDAIALGRLLRLRGQPEGVELQVRARLADPALSAVLGLRAAQRLMARGDLARAWSLAREAWVRHPPLGGPSVERLALRADQLPDWSRTLHRVPAAFAPADRVRHALLHELALDDAAGALSALGDAELDGGLAALRLVARVADRVEPERRRRAWQQEAQQTEHTERRVDLFVRVARLTIGRPGEMDRALTYLLWALDHDPEHPIALVLLEHVSRLLGRAGPLAEVLEQGLRWRVEPADRAEAMRELARITERHGGSPLAVAAWLERALAELPDDDGLADDLDRCLRAGEAWARVEALYEARLARPLAEGLRAEIGLKLGHLRAARRDDEAGAVQAFQAALAVAPAGQARDAIEAALARLAPAEMAWRGASDQFTVAEGRPLGAQAAAAAAGRSPAERFARPGPTAILDADGRAAWDPVEAEPTHDGSVSLNADDAVVGAADLDADPADDGEHPEGAFEVEVPLTDETYNSFGPVGEPEPSEGAMPLPRRSGGEAGLPAGLAGEPERNVTTPMPDLPETPGSAADWIPAPDLPPLPPGRGGRALDGPPSPTPHPLALGEGQPAAESQGAAGRSDAFFGPRPTGAGPAMGRAAVPSGPGVVPTPGWGAPRPGEATTVDGRPLAARPAGVPRLRPSEALRAPPGFEPESEGDRTLAQDVPAGALLAALSGSNEPSVDPSVATDLDVADAASSSRDDRSALAGFLGEEVTRDAAEDPARAAVRRKLSRTRTQDLGANWRDHGRPEVSAAIVALLAADDTDTRHAAASALGDAYAAAGQAADARRAWQMALGYRAGDAAVESRLERLYRAEDDHRALAELLAGRAHRTGDKLRCHAVLLEVARLHAGPLDDPGAAVGFYREALAQDVLGVNDAAEVASELAVCLSAIRRWREYVEVLAAHHLSDPEDLLPEASLELGRIHLHALGDGDAALPYLVRAARALPERADVVAELAEIHAARGEAAAAVDLLESTLARLDDPGRGAERADLALRIARIAEARLGDMDRAGVAYGRALAEGVRDPGVLERAEELALQARDWQRLVQILDARRASAAQAGLSVADQRDLAVRLGHLHHTRLRQPEAAAEAFVDAFVLDPHDEDVFRQARALVDRLQRPDLRARLLSAWLGAFGPAHPDALANGLEHLVALEEAEQVTEAVTAVEALASRHGTDPRVREARARVHLAASNWSVVAELARGELADVEENHIDRVAEALATGRPAGPDPRLAALRRLAHAEEVGLRDLAAATATWQHLVRLSPEDAQALAALTRLLEAQKRWGELLDVSARELERVTAPRQRAFVLFRMGSLYETHLADAVGAARCYREALENDPRCFPALHGLRDLAVHADDWPAVVENLHAELALWDDPKERAAILARIGEIRERRLGDAEGAVRAYEQAVGLFPACVPAARALAGRAMAAGRPADAAPLLATLTAQKLDKWPRAERAEVFTLRGQCALQLGRRREAIESLKLALDFVPAQLEALGSLVDAVHAEPASEEDLAELSRRVQAAATAAGHTDDVHAQARVSVVRGRAAEAQGDLAGAAECYAEAAAARPDDLALCAPLVDLWLAQGRFELACAVLESFAAVQSPDADDAAARDRQVAALLRAGDIWAQVADDPARGLDCYQRARRASPSLRTAAWRAVQCQAAMGALPEADAGLARLLAMPALPDQERARYRAFAGHLGLRMGDPVAGEQALREALVLDPLAAEPLTALLRLLDARGDHERLDQLLGHHAALVTDPPETVAGAAMATVLAGISRRRGQLDTARRLLVPLSRRSGPAGNAARLALSEVSIETGDRGRALGLLQANLEADLTDRAALDLLARLYEVQGDVERLYPVLMVRALYGGLDAPRAARLAGLHSQDATRFQGAGPSALALDALYTDLGPPGLRSPLLRLWGPLDTVLAARFGGSPEPGRSLVDGAGAEPITGAHRWSESLQPVARLLDVEGLSVWSVPAQAEAVRLEVGPAPRVGLGAPLLAAGVSDAERRFALARAVLFLRLGLGRLHDLGPTQGRQALFLLESVWRSEGPADSALGAIDPEAEARARVVLRGATGPLVPQHTGEAACVAVTQAADRAGLLAAGSLRVAVEHLVRTARIGYDLQPGEDLRWAVRSEPRVAALVRYALSEAWPRARRAAGLTLKSR